MAIASVLHQISIKTSARGMAAGRRTVCHAQLAPAPPCLAPQSRRPLRRPCAQNRVRDAIGATALRARMLAAPQATACIPLARRCTSLTRKARISSAIPSPVKLRVRRIQKAMRQTSTLVCASGTGPNAPQRPLGTKGDALHCIHTQPLGLAPSIARRVSQGRRQWPCAMGTEMSSNSVAATRVRTSGHSLVKYGQAAAQMVSTCERTRRRCFQL